MKQGRFIFLLLVFFIGLSGFFSIGPTALANSSNQVVIRDSDNIHKGKIYQLWHLNQTYSKELEQELRSLTVAELTTAYVDTVVSEPTDDFGSTRVFNLSEGLYYGLEIDSYGNRYETTEPFFINLSSEINRSIVVNPKSNLARGSLTIYKKGIDPNHIATDVEALQGVVFELYYQNSDMPISFVEGQANADGKGSSRLITDEMGLIKVSELVPGNYYLKEVKPLAGYKVLESPINLEIKADEVTKLTVENVKTNLGGYKFRKVDNKQETLGLAGAEFKVMQDNEVILANVTSDENGFFEVVDLPYGYYQLVETKAPVHNGVLYQLLENPLEFEVTGTSYYQEYVLAVANHPVNRTPPDNKPPVYAGRLPFTGEKSVGFKVLLALILILLAVALIIKSHLKNRFGEDEVHE